MDFDWISYSDRQQVVNKPVFQGICQFTDLAYTKKH